MKVKKNEEKINKEKFFFELVTEGTNLTKISEILVGESKWYPRFIKERKPTETRQTMSSGYKSDKGEMPIHIALKKGNSELVEMLLYFGKPEDVNAGLIYNNREYRSVHFAVGSGNIDCLNYLVAHKANILNIKGGISALKHYAKSALMSEYLDSNEFRELVNLHNSNCLQLAEIPKNMRFASNENKQVSPVKDQKKLRITSFFTKKSVIFDVEEQSLTSKESASRSDTMETLDESLLRELSSEDEASKENYYASSSSSRGFIVQSRQSPKETDSLSRLDTQETIIDSEFDEHTFENKDLRKNYYASSSSSSRGFQNIVQSRQSHPRERRNFSDLMNSIENSSSSSNTFQSILTKDTVSLGRRKFVEIIDLTDSLECYANKR